MAKYYVGCIKTTNLPYTIISLDGRKYIKKIFVEKFDNKFEGAIGGKESQRSAAAAADQVVVCVRVCL